MLCFRSACLFSLTKVLGSITCIQRGTGNVPTVTLAGSRQKRISMDTRDTFGTFCRMVHHSQNNDQCTVWPRPTRSYPVPSFAEVGAGLFVTVGDLCLRFYYFIGKYLKLPGATIFAEGTPATLQGANVFFAHLFRGKWWCFAVGVRYRISQKW